MADAARRRPPIGGRVADRARGPPTAARTGLCDVTELPLMDGRRADVVALGGDGALLIVEIKSSVADFRADHKWRDYAAHCDRLYFAISDEMPPEIMPDEAGLIVADRFGAEIVREADRAAIAPATRRAVMLRFAIAAADRLHRLADPNAGM